MTRLKCFDTVTLPNRRPGVAAHMQEHAMEHLHWMADFINDHRDSVDPKELFYEGGATHNVCTLKIARDREMDLLRQGRLNAMVPGISPVGNSDDMYQVSI